MGDLDISRPLTESEKQDTVEIGRPGILDVFLQKLAKKQQEYQKAMRPFDIYGARVDFDERLQKLRIDLNTAVDKSKVATKINVDNLDRYGSSSRFEFIESRDNEEDKLLDGIRTRVKTGKSYSFRTKERGNLLVVFVPNTGITEMDAWIEKEFNSSKKAGK